ncbi:hypothetical protein JRO89_XS03G0216800 [Xanthoceras sorbifolium]|uniref:Uncharacterized protein n=1 Tax=Xanthoceras sorbifolium TaxID=99658 RepID=A0ABQ8IBK0_9ROSI|nr:hypothetical protein JRO89_XS03G0216800 [Xanthoceras sorbifolium]
MFTISSNLMKKAIPLCACSPVAKTRSPILSLSCKTPPEFPTENPDYQPTTVPLEVPEIPKTPEVDDPIPPEVEITVPEPPSLGQWPNPAPDIPIPPPPPPPPTPPDNPLPPPPPLKLPLDPSPDIIPPPSLPPNIEPTPSVPLEIQRPTGNLGSFVF